MKPVLALAATLVLFHAATACGQLSSDEISDALSNNPKVEFTLTYPPINQYDHAVYDVQTTTLPPTVTEHRHLDLKPIVVIPPSQPYEAPTMVTSAKVQIDLTSPPSHKEQVIGNWSNISQGGHLTDVRDRSTIVDDPSNMFDWQSPYNIYGHVTCKNPGGNLKSKSYDCDFASDITVGGSGNYAGWMLTVLVTGSKQNGCSEDPPKYIGAEKKAFVQKNNFVHVGCDKDFNFSTEMSISVN